jgi:hypothetical protein
MPIADVKRRVSVRLLTARRQVVDGDAGVEVRAAPQSSRTARPRGSSAISVLGLTAGA